MTAFLFVAKAGAAAAGAVCVAVSVAACQPSSSSPPEVTTYQLGQAAEASPGNGQIPEIAVVTGSIHNAAPGDVFSSPPAGSHLEAVSLDLSMAAPLPPHHDQFEDLGLAVTGTGELGRHYPVALAASVKGCDTFSGDVQLTSTGHVTGCVAFFVKNGDKLVSIAFRAGSGRSSRVAEWVL